jgi:hypothetical protein
MINGLLLIGTESTHVTVYEPQRCDVNPGSEHELYLILFASSAGGTIAADPR